MKFFYEKKNKRILGKGYERIIAHFTSDSFKRKLNELLLDATDSIGCYPDEPYGYIGDEYSKYLNTHHKELFFFDGIQYQLEYELNQKPYDHLGYCLYFEHRGEDRLLLCWEFDNIVERGLFEKYNQKCIDMGYGEYNPCKFIKSMI